jgi:hypothetical protein
MSLLLLMQERLHLVRSAASLRVLLFLLHDPQHILAVLGARAGVLLVHVVPVVPVVDFVAAGLHSGNVQSSRSTSRLEREQHSGS